MLYHLLFNINSVLISVMRRLNCAAADFNFRRNSCACSRVLDPTTRSTEKSVSMMLVSVSSLEIFPLF